MADARHTLVAHWIFPSEVNRKNHFRLQNHPLFAETRKYKYKYILWIISAFVASNGSQIRFFSLQMAFFPPKSNLNNDALSDVVIVVRSRFDTRPYKYLSTCIDNVTGNIVKHAHRLFPPKRNLHNYVFVLFTCREIVVCLECFETNQMWELQVNVLFPVNFSSEMI